MRKNKFIRGWRIRSGHERTPVTAIAPVPAAAVVPIAPEQPIDPAPRKRKTKAAPVEPVAVMAEPVATDPAPALPPAPSPAVGSAVGHGDDLTDEDLERLTAPTGGA